MVKKKIALLLHGFPGLSKKDPVSKYFLSKGYETVIPALFKEDMQFNIENIKIEIAAVLKNKMPDVIAGISLGGLLLPHIAILYPKAKIIFIATGPKISIGIKPYQKLVMKGNINILGMVFRLIKLIPFGMFVSAYRFFNPPVKSETGENEYRDNIAETFRNFRNLSRNKMTEVLNFARITDNTSLLKGLNNKALIIAGGHDVLMPEKLSKELRLALKKSQYLENSNRLHYEVFDERDYEKMDVFLSGSR